jgi:formylglycine-generating enzyme required for sulfatase activity
MNQRLGLQQLPMNISQDTLYEFPSIRLPTEWEWQAAALGLDSWNYPWGSSWKANHANTRESGLGRTTTVGVYPEGDSRDGAMDMCGNVWEWCLNEYKNIPKLGMSSPYPRSWRGGSFLSDKNESRGKHRSGERPEERAAFVGFRVCISWPDIWVD